MGMDGTRHVLFAREQDLAGKCACVHCENHICMAEHELQALAAKHAHISWEIENRSRKKTTQSNTHVFLVLLRLLCACAPKIVLSF
jgi:hypothetical protein